VSQKDFVLKQVEHVLLHV